MFKSISRRTEPRPLTALTQYAERTSGPAEVVAPVGGGPSVAGHGGDLKSSACTVVRMANNELLAFRKVRPVLGLLQFRHNPLHVHRGRRRRSDT